MRLECSGFMENAAGPSFPGGFGPSFLGEGQVELSSGAGEVLQEGRRPEHLWGLLDNFYLIHFLAGQGCQCQPGHPRGGCDIQICVFPSPWGNQPGPSMGLRDPWVRAGLAVGGQGVWRVLSRKMGHPWVLF